MVVRLLGVVERRTVVILRVVLGAPVGPPPGPPAPGPPGAPPAGAKYLTSRPFNGWTGLLLPHKRVPLVPITFLNLFA